MSSTRAGAVRGLLVAGHLAAPESMEQGFRKEQLRPLGKGKRLEESVEMLSETRTRRGDIRKDGRVGVGVGVVVVVVAVQ
jgi:hypothetical protein